MVRDLANTPLGQATMPRSTPGSLSPYYANRWWCMRCGKFISGSHQPPPQQSRCYHCKKTTAVLEVSCKGMTTRTVPFWDTPNAFTPGVQKNGAAAQWWAPPPKRIHRKGYKRKKGEKDKPTGYTRSEVEDD